MQFEPSHQSHFSRSSYDIHSHRRSQFLTYPLTFDDYDIKTPAYNRYSLQIPLGKRYRSIASENPALIDDSPHYLSCKRTCQNEYSRSSSNCNLNECFNSQTNATKFRSRYSTDDLTPLHTTESRAAVNLEELQHKSYSRANSSQNVFDPKDAVFYNHFHPKVSVRNSSQGARAVYCDGSQADNYRERVYFDNTSDSYIDEDIFTRHAINPYEENHYCGKMRRSDISPSDVNLNNYSTLNERDSVNYDVYNTYKSAVRMNHLTSRNSPNEDKQHCIRDQFKTLQSKIKRVSKNVYIKPPSTQHCSQIIATMIASIGPLCAGLGKGYSSPALASMVDLSAQGYHFSISMDQGSWVASLSLLGAFFGSFPAGIAIKWGRKKVLCAIAIPFAFSWVLTFLSINVYMLYIAALIGGACTAVISVVTPVYISEIAHPDIRGCLCSFSKLTGNIGMLISYLLGAFLNWRQLATVTAIAPVCLFISTLFIPETPSFLIYRGRDKEAAESLKWLRGSKGDISKELTTMKTNIASLRRKSDKNNPSEGTRELIRPLFITCGLMVFQKFSGANAFNFYAVPILSETFVGLNPYRTAIVVAFVQICAGMASSALLDTVGRRPLLVFSNMLMSIALAALGVYVYLKGLDKNENIFEEHEWRESDWVPLFCILVIEIAYAIGVSPISWLYIGEIFPLKHRGYGAIAASVSYACSFASVKTFVDFQSWIGLYGAFWFYSSVAALALVFTLLYVPETKGKSLQEMEMRQPTKEILV